MAVLSDGGNFAVTTTAQRVSEELVLTTGNVHFNRVTVKNATGAAHPIYIGGSDVEGDGTEAHIQLTAGQSYDFYSGAGWLVNIRDIYVSVETEDATVVAFVNCMA
jgi:hypothetical protein